MPKAGSLRFPGRLIRCRPFHAQARSGLALLAEHEAVVQATRMAGDMIGSSSRVGLCDIERMTILFADKPTRSN